MLCGIVSDGKNFLQRSLEDVLPKNILMIGSTGVGKTEIARRLARIADSPFIKIEASKFTEVGYVGRDVESMIRELTDVAVDMAKQAAYRRRYATAEENAEERLLDLLLAAIRNALSDAGDSKDLNLASPNPSKTAPAKSFANQLRTRRS